MTFDLNALPAEDLLADIDNNGQDERFKYLALNYLLVGDKKNEENLTDITFVWTTEDGKTNDPVTEYSNIPVQRNYRTNIIGWLLTNPAEFNIIIDEEFEKPDYNIIAIDGTVNAGKDAEVLPNDGFMDEPENVATIANKHITAAETAVELDELPADAEDGVLYIKNTTVNAETFLEINGRFTVVRNCHLNVKTLLKNNTNYRDLQIIFQDCYVNGTPLTEDNIDEYVDVDDFGTVLAYFNGSSQGGNQGGNEGEGNEGGNIGDDIKMSEVANELGKLTSDGFFTISDKKFAGTVTLDKGMDGSYGQYSFIGVTFEKLLKLQET